MTLSETISQAEPNDELHLDVLVIGAGLFGSIIGEALQHQGRNVSYIDAMHPHAGSRPAACLMKPGWLAGMGKENYNASLNLLDDLFGIVDLEFVTKPLNKRVTVHWIPPHRILKYNEATKGTVKRIMLEDSAAYVLASINNQEYRINARLIIAACGYWSSKLFTMPNLAGQAGVAFSWHGLTPANTIKVWAPYKQVVTLNNWKKGEVWVGDGSAILPQNWTAERQESSLRRCADHINRSALEATTYYGIRPYIKGWKDPCYCEKPYSNLWVVTGGAKNGTASAGWAASTIIGLEI